MALFDAAIFDSVVFDTGDSVVDNGWLGGTFTDPYYEIAKRKQAQRIREAQEEVIQLKQEQQELRLRELEALEAKDKQTKRQLLSVERKKIELAAEVARIMALIDALQAEQITPPVEYNTEYLLIAAACPWLNIGGETMR